MSFAAVLHLVLHALVPAAAAWLLFRKRWRRALLIMLATMVVDLDLRSAALQHRLSSAAPAAGHRGLRGDDAVANHPHCRHRPVDSHGAGRQ
jgi:hypothetical protein